jgi:hypothetical protein
LSAFAPGGRLQDHIGDDDHQQLSESGAADHGAGEHHGGAAVLDLVLRETPAARGSKAAGLPRSGSGRAHGRNPVRRDGGAK